MQTGEQFVIPYTLLDMAEDIIRLLDLLSIDKAHIIGSSMGGWLHSWLLRITRNVYYPFAQLCLHQGTPTCHKANPM